MDLQTALERLKFYEDRDIKYKASVVKSKKRPVYIENTKKYSQKYYQTLKKFKSLLQKSKSLEFIITELEKKPNTDLLTLKIEYLKKIIKCIKTKSNDDDIILQKSNHLEMIIKHLRNNDIGLVVSKNIYLNRSFLKMVEIEDFNIDMLKLRIEYYKLILKDYFKDDSILIIKINYLQNILDFIQSQNGNLQNIKISYLEMMSSYFINSSR